MLCELCKWIRHLFGYAKLVIMLPGGGFALLARVVRRAKGRSSADLEIKGICGCTSNRITPLRVWSNSCLVQSQKRGALGAEVVQDAQKEILHKGGP